MIDDYVAVVVMRLVLPVLLLLPLPFRVLLLSL